MGSLLQLLSFGNLFGVVGHLASHRGETAFDLFSHCRFLIAFAGGCPSMGTSVSTGMVVVGSCSSGTCYASEIACSTAASLIASGAGMAGVSASGASARNTTFAG